MGSSCRTKDCNLELYVGTGYSTNMVNLAGFVCGNQNIILSLFRK